MPIDLDTEECMPLAKAARLLPAVRGGKPPHPMTLYRWATRGILSRSGKRVLLETEFIGGTRVTSKEALSRFFRRKNDVRYREIADSPPKQLEQRAQAAKRILQDLGMLD